MEILKNKCLIKMYRLNHRLCINNKKDLLINKNK